MVSMKFLLSRLLGLLPTLFGVTLIAFGLIRLVPGDPVEIMMGERALTPERHAALMQELGLDVALPQQYLRYLGQLLQGDLGRSLVTREPVVSELAARFPATLELAAAALAVSVSLGLVTGVLAALRRGGWLDRALMTLATVGHSMPVFWWALILIMFFSVGLGWTPISGRLAVEYDIERHSGFMLIDAWRSGQDGALASTLRHLALPALTLGTYSMAVVARMTRASLLEVLREDFVRTARAKGLGEGVVIVRHALRNALIPVITVIGLQAGGLLGGAVLTETIFSWPGIGKWLIDAIARRDYPVVQAGILLTALTFIAVNLLVDLLYGVADPRMRRVSA